MLTLTQAVDTFPSVRILSHGGGLTVSVTRDHHLAGVGKMVDAGLGGHWGV